MKLNKLRYCIVSIVFLRGSVCDDFLWCSVLWKLLLKNGTVNSVLVKVAQRTQPKKLAAFMRRMADYIIFTLPEQLDNVSTVINVHVIVGHVTVM